MEKINFKAVADYLRGTGYPNEPEKVYIRIQEAKQHLFDGIKYFTKDDAVWNDCYEPIADWLTDNKGKGLLLAGECGLGKSLIGMRIIPLLLNWYCRKVVAIYTAQEMNNKIDEVLQKHIIYIDDIGTENVSNVYGNKRIPFSELCDAAERDGKLLMMSTNLSFSQLTEKYGERTADRLKAVTRTVVFRGKSLRK